MRPQPCAEPVVFAAFTRDFFFIMLRHGYLTPIGLRTLREVFRQIRGIVRCVRREKQSSEPTPIGSRTESGTVPFYLMQLDTVTADLKKEAGL